MTDEDKTREQLLEELRKLRLRVGEPPPASGGDPCPRPAARGDLYRTLADAAQDIIFVVDRKGYVLYVNPFAAAYFSSTPGEIIGKSLRDLFPAESCEQQQRAVGEVFKTGSPLFVEERFSFPERGIWLDTRLIPIRGDDNEVTCVLGISRDTTERKKLDAEAQRVERLESLAVFAGGIVHEFNNVLTAIAGNLLLAKMYARPESEVFDILTEAERASLRAGDLIRQLMAFSQGGAPRKKASSLPELIEKTAAGVLKDKAPDGKFFLPPDLWTVEADETQLGQAVSNVLVNAEQAMPRGGVITISAENVVIDAKSLLPLKKGKYVRLSVGDSGDGIDEAHMEKIFDPFFTTKEKGRGLGLASAFSIVKNHGGCISVESKAGAGTVIHIYLPATGDEVAAVEREDKTQLSGKRRILVMDDEEIVRNVIGRMLNQCGCEADFAVEGAEMIDRYKEALEAGEPFDAVIVDLVVANGMGGRDAIGKLLEVDADAKAIVSSGYSDGRITADYRKFGFRGVLPKPYSLADLGRVLREVIAEDERGSADA
jgi:two-component system cell cycle sensor histidine kinase/response regulator CckA